MSQEHLYREFKADLAVGDGRTVDVRIVPYGERITHDGSAPAIGIPPGDPFQEEFMPGVFDHQLNAPNRVHANIEHDQSSIAKAGHGIVLREAKDGFYGTFRLLKNQAGETARELIEAGALDGISLEGTAVRTVRSREGVMQRAKANLRAIAFTRFGAYEGAKVLALREEAVVVNEIETVPELDPEVVERCRRLGIKLPQRYEAHPATDTPAAAGTPESTPAVDDTHDASTED